MAKIGHHQDEIPGYAEYNGEEIDVTIHFSTSPPEPDVNWGGGVEIECVTYTPLDKASAMLARFLRKPLEIDITDRVNLTDMYSQVDAHLYSRAEEY